MCEKGEQFLVVKLGTFGYTSYFLNLLTVALTFCTYSAKVQVSQFLSIVCTRFAKVHGLSLPTSFFCPIDPPSWLPFTFVWGTVLVFCQLLVSFFGLVFPFLFPVTFLLSASKSHGLNKDKRSNQLKPFLLKRSSMPFQRQEQIKEPREPQIQALPSPFSKLHRLHFPSSTDPIFQAAPGSPYFPSSAFRIFQVSIFHAPPSPFSKLHRPYFPSSAVSIFQAPPSPTN